ncbi:uncharacterized protein K02A2.6-like [Diaphorina citri]|uniref:RNA-directed DNA polymerase n=1 Tax=Diaphorina citri TaxID=121845 RepID=A0A1S3DNT9_DIACI|nr:uncharacterized protein K02A2.6-like [Diaphorina citri]
MSESGILYYDGRIIIPTSLKKHILELVHSGHQGFTKTKLKATESVYWVNMNSDIEEYVNKCKVCDKFKHCNTRDELSSHEIVCLPFSKLGVDIMTFGGKDYLVVIDYYTKWLEILPIKTKTCNEIICKLSELFSTHGIPSQIVSDNSPFGSYEVSQFAKKYNIKWIYSSPHYARSNGMAERGIQIAKNIMKKSLESGVSFYELLLEYRSTPIPDIGVAPSVMLMGRRLKTKIPISDKNLKPLGSLDEVHTMVQDKINLSKEKSKSYHDKLCKQERIFVPGQTVLVWDFNNKIWEAGRLLKKLDCPRSYLVRVRGRVLRRNVVHLRATEGDYLVDDRQDCNGDVYDFRQNIAQNVERNMLVHRNTNVPTISDPNNEVNNLPNRINSHVSQTRFGRQIRRPQRLNL